MIAPVWLSGPIGAMDHSLETREYPSLLSALFAIQHQLDEAEDNEDTRSWRWELLDEDGNVLDRLKVADDPNSPFAVYEVNEDKVGMRLA